MRYWITQSGEKLKVKNMTIVHIENCIKMLQKLLRSRPIEQSYMGNSDIAEQAVEMENIHNANMTEEIINTIRNFKRELHRRKI